MKKAFGDLCFRDYILLVMIAIMTLILPSLLFQPRKNAASPKTPRKNPVILADASSLRETSSLQKQLYYHDPKAFLEGDDSHSFAYFRIREQKPEYLLTQVGTMPSLVTDHAAMLQPGPLPGKDRPAVSSLTLLPMSLPPRAAQVPHKIAYPMLFNTDGKPLSDCRIRVNNNTVLPKLPTKLQINIPQLDAIPGFIYVELIASSGNRKLDLLAQRTINQYLLANSRKLWQNGGILTVYWQQNAVPADFPEDDAGKGGRS